jgi:hypothetical protein
MPSSGALRHSAPALAGWAVLLTGWVWLGQQGQRLGWSLASGVLAVALWWALRVLFAQSGFVHRLPRQASVWLGAVTVGGAMGVASLPASPTAHALLLALAGVWALWSAALEAGSRGACTTATRGLPAAASLPQTTMGLMMGSLWLSTNGCALAGLPPATVVGFHVLLMSALPVLASRWRLPPQWPCAAQALPLALLLAGSLVLQLGNGVVHGATGMALLALGACAAEGNRLQRMEKSPTSPLFFRLWCVPQPSKAGANSTLSPAVSLRFPLPRRLLAGALQGAPLHTARHCTALAGPALLLAVGWWSTTLGPQALQAAYGLLGAVAFLALLRLGAQTASRCVHHPSTQETLHEQH